MGGLRRVLTFLALLACGVVFNQAHALTDGTGGSTFGEDAGYWWTSQSAAEGDYISRAGAGTYQNQRAWDGCPAHSHGCMVEDWCQAAHPDRCQAAVGFGVCDTGYVFDQPSASCIPGTPPACQTPTGTHNPRIALPGDAQDQQSCMGGCAVAYEAGMSIHANNVDQTGTYGDWIVQGPPGGMGNSCDTTDGHQTPLPDEHGNDCTGDLCVNFPNDSICDNTGACIALNDIPPSGCSQTPGGNMFCTSDAPTPPAPDNGTPGDKAPADGTANGSGNVCPNGATTCSYSYSNSSTTTNSTTHSGSSGGGAGGSSGGTSGAGASSGSSGGASSSGSSGAGTCDASKSKCGTGGSDPFTGPGGDSKSFQQSMSDFQTQVGTAPLATALNGLGDAAPDSGSLPSGTFTMFNHSYTLAPPQQVVDAVQPVLLVVMRCVWLVLAAFYFFRR